MVRIKAPQMTAIQKLRSCGLTIATGDDADMEPPDRQGYMHLFPCINKRIRTQCQGELRYPDPDFRMRAMQKAPSQSLDSTACNCLALRQAARHVTQIYDSYLASEGLRTTQYSILSKLNRLGPLSI